MTPTEEGQDSPAFATFAAPVVAGPKRDDIGRLVQGGAGFTGA
jgi:hypothetical protein